MNEVVVGLFAKAPVPGNVKTRLTAVVSEHAAAELHAQLVWHALSVASVCLNVPVQLWVDDIRHPFFLSASRCFNAVLFQQSGGDLGQRMAHAFDTVNKPMLLMGSDCPSITPAMLRHCALQLRHLPAVYLPAEDGGYGLVGLQQLRPELFVDIPWGGGRVMEATRQRLRSLGLQWSEPFTVWDVDRPADLARLSGEVLSAETSKAAKLALREAPTDFDWL